MRSSCLCWEGAEPSARRQEFFTWEKNVDEMNGKGTCRRLLVKKKRKERKMRSGLIRRKAAETQEVKSLLERKHTGEDKDVRGNTQPWQQQIPRNPFPSRD